MSWFHVQVWEHVPAFSAQSGTSPSPPCPHFHTRVRSGLYDRVETQPGLDKFWNDPQGLEQKALGPLLKWAKAVVPAEQQASTPLFLMATAGVRRLQQNRRDALLSSVRQLLCTSGFR